MTASGTGLVRYDIPRLAVLWLASQRLHMLPMRTEARWRNFVVKAANSVTAPAYPTLAKA